MPRPRSGTFEPVTYAGGRVVFRGRLRLSDGTKSDRFDLPAGMNERQARAYLSGLQAEEDTAHVVFKAKQDRLAHDAVGGDVWVVVWLGERKRRGLTSWQSNKAHYDDHIRPVVL